MARAHTVAAIAALVRVLDSGDDKAAVAAANALLDRACGKPTQEVEAKVNAAIGPRYDFSGLTVSEKRELRKILAKVPEHGQEMPAIPGADTPDDDAPNDDAPGA